MTRNSLAPTSQYQHRNQDWEAQSQDIQFKTKTPQSSMEGTTLKKIFETAVMINSDITGFLHSD